MHPEPMLERNLSEERSKMTKEVKTLSAIAKAFGEHARVALADTLAHHKAFTNAEKDVQNEMKAEYMVSYIMGLTKWSEAKAKDVLEATKADRSEKEQDAYYAANSSFRYHISRPEGGAKGAAKIGSSDLVKAAMKLVAKMTAAQKRKLTRLMAE